MGHRDKITCTALCDLSESNLKGRSEQLGGVSGMFQDWRSMLAKSGDQFDAVDICLPHHLHADAILAAAVGRRGVHASRKGEPSCECRT
ncbi:MAG: hypothetical protein O3B24_05015 [Verrucomicrobia bacterium]|nr:hypothetical protein [Verrucomicrobiota bacterium]